MCDLSNIKKNKGLRGLICDKMMIVFLILCKL